MKTSLFRARPHLWYQLYWVVYLIWFFWLDLTVTDPKYIIHSPLDDFIPFNEWFIFPYGSWFFLLAGVTALLWCSISAPGSVEIFGKIYSFLLPLLLTALMPAGTMVVADISHFRALPVSEGA